MYSDFGKIAVEEAEKRGASYVDVRISEIVNENLTVKNGEPETIRLSQNKGFGIRVIVNWAWGFAGSVETNKEEMKKTVERACAWASDVCEHGCGTARFRKVRVGLIK